MRHIKALLGAVLALLIVGLAMGAQAFGENGVLPRPTGAVSATSEESVFQSKNGLEVKCKEDKGTVSFSDDEDGTFSVSFLKCTGPLGVKCTGLSDSTTGSITVSGSFELEDLLGSSTLNGIVLSPSITHFSCGAVLSVVRGRAVGNFSISGGVGTISLGQNKGVNDITDTASVSGLILETSTSGGKFEQSGEETTETMLLPEGTEVMG